MICEFDSHTLLKGEMIYPTIAWSVLFLILESMEDNPPRIENTDYSVACAKDNKGLLPNDWRVI